MSVSYALGVLAPIRLLGEHPTAAAGVTARHIARAIILYAYAF